jgi:hypothetical protein
MKTSEQSAATSQNPHPHPYPSIQKQVEAEAYVATLKRGIKTNDESFEIIRALAREIHTAPKQIIPSEKFVNGSKSNLDTQTGQSDVIHDLTWMLGEKLARLDDPVRAFAQLVLTLTDAMDGELDTHAVIRD